MLAGCLERVLSWRWCIPRVKTERVSNGSRGTPCGLGTTEKPPAWDPMKVGRILGLLERIKVRTLFGKLQELQSGY